MKINIVRYDDSYRNYSYMAYVVGDASKCGFGNTRKRALGELVARNQAVFCVEIMDLTPKLSFASVAENKDCILY